MAAILEFNMADKLKLNGFTGFIDPENVGVATEITLLSALDSKL